MSRTLAFFGAFNPPTLAHLELSRLAMEQTEAGGVVFVPSKMNYILQEQKKDFAYTDQERLSMLNAAAEKRPWMRVTDWELRQPAQPRTYETLRVLRNMGFSPVLLLGSDKLPELETGWQRVEDICREFGIVCLARGNDPCGQMLRENPYLRSLAPYIRLIQTPASFRQVSSSAVRQRAAQIRALRKELEAMEPEEILPLL